MKMQENDKKTLMEILSTSNQCTVKFKTPVKDNYSNIHEVLILECNAATINALIAHGFNMSMTKKGLSVYRF